MTTIYPQDDYYFACVIVSPLTTSAMSMDMRAPVCTNRYSVQSSTCGLQCICLHGYCSCQETKGSENSCCVLQHCENRQCTSKVSGGRCSAVRCQKEGALPLRCQEEGALPVWCQEEGVLPVWCQEEGALPVLCQKEGALL